MHLGLELKRLSDKMTQSNQHCHGEEGNFHTIRKEILDILKYYMEKPPESLELVQKVLNHIITSISKVNVMEM
ncbi:hypothetical protein [Desulfosporosinus sp. SB140]|uniref:hypothetical protein n=1 Tax=Desulfosporosinus paludis TaxID=3115649 RepID=UPI00388F9309